MSFSSATKQELSRLPLGRPCCQHSELAAFVRMAGTLEIGAGGALALRMDADSADIARRAFKLLRSCYGVDGEFSIRHRHPPGMHPRYQLRVKDEAAARRILEQAGVLSQGEEGPQLETSIPARLLRRDCCRSAYLRGAFLAAGSMTDPQRGYHLEYVVTDAEVAQRLALLLRAFELNAKTMARKDTHVVYLKESEHIGRLLALIGATSALLELENIRSLRSLRNDVNRAVNCETANLSKTGRAAQRQVEAIRLLEETGEFSRLGEDLRRVAELRVSFPEATLEELAHMIPGLGRSGVNHRLRKLCELARQAQEQRGETI